MLLERNLILLCADRPNQPPSSDLTATSAHMHAFWPQHLHTCMHSDLNICTHACILTSTSAHMHAFWPQHLHTCMHSDLNICTHACILTSTSAHMHAFWPQHAKTIVGLKRRTLHGNLQPPNPLKPNPLTHFRVLTVSIVRLTALFVCVGVSFCLYCRDQMSPEW